MLIDNPRMLIDEKTLFLPIVNTEGKKPVEFVQALFFIKNEEL